MSDTLLFKKELLEDDKISNDGLSVYAAIYKNYYGNEKMLITSVLIEDTLFERPGTDNERRFISNGFKELVNAGYITILNEYRDNGYKCDVSNITYYDPSKHYVSLTYEELKKIMKIKDLKYKILRYVLILYGTFETGKKCSEKYRFKIGYMPINYISLISGLSVVTINKYNKILKENNIIYISRRRTMRSPGNGHTGFLVKWESNVYSRYEDKDLCEEYAKLNGCATESDQRKRELDESRRYLQLYNSMIAGKEYDLELISEIFNAVKDWNKRKIEKYEEDISNGKKVQEPKLKDLSIFDKYGLK